MNESDEELVRRSQKSDRAAFEELVRRTARLVFSRLYLETGDSHRTEDLVQDTFLLAWRNIRQVHEPSGFRSWLFTLAHSAVIDAARRERRRKRFASGGGASHSLQEMTDASPSPDEAAEREESRQTVLSHIRSLPEEYRLPITLRYIGGADYETIGRQLGLTNGSLRGLLNRGMSRLRAAMKPEEK